MTASAPYTFYMKTHPDFTHSNYPFNGEIAPTEHFVLDARTKPRKDTPTHDNGEKKPFSKGKTILLSVMITILAFSLTLIAADLFGNSSGIKIYTSLFYKDNKNATTYYAVYATHSADMSLSYQNAAVIRKEGGAGYVMKEGDEYYVILNVYEDEENAKSISERKANYGILEIKVYDFDIDKQPSLKAAENSKYLYKEAYVTLYQAANDLASGKYAKDDMTRSLLSYKEKVVAIENAYAESISGSIDTACIEYKVILAEIRSAFDNLEHNAENLVADARYFSVMIVKSYALFTQKYFS